MSNDNRLENLELLCPNCHSQTPTFCRAKKSLLPKVKRNSKPRPTKIKWPPENELVNLVKSSNFRKAAQKLGVSDNAIRKRLKKLGLLKEVK